LKKLHFKMSERDSTVVKTQDGEPAAEPSTPAPKSERPGSPREEKTVSPKSPRWRRSSASSQLQSPSRTTENMSDREKLSLEIDSLEEKIESVEKEISNKSDELSVVEKRLAEVMVGVEERIVEREAALTKDMERVKREERQVRQKLDSIAHTKKITKETLELAQRNTFAPHASPEVVEVDLEAYTQVRNSLWAGLEKILKERNGVKKQMRGLKKLRTKTLNSLTLESNFEAMLLSPLDRYQVHQSRPETRRAISPDDDSPRLEASEDLRRPASQSIGQPRRRQSGALFARIERLQADAAPIQRQLAMLERTAGSLHRKLRTLVYSHWKD